MFKLEGMEDTIVAISTAMGQGSIGLIRLSGKESVPIADKLFKAKSGKLISQCKTFTLHYGSIIDAEGDVIDEVLLTLMRAPKSYTTEDVVEISCHGGVVSLKAILNRVLCEGARLAAPGEFTKRAFLNGRIDLAQAEAVLDIISSKTDAFLKVSTNQLKGDLSVELEIIREALMKSFIELEAIVNFPEDDIDQSGINRLNESVLEAQHKIKSLLESSDHGRILKEGIKIVLCGKPNVGKSSLLNCLLKSPRAIVSDIAGTTRDTIEETAQIGGIPFQLIDTAGMLDPRDLVEQEAVKRSHLSIKQADLVLLVIDGSSPLDEEDQKLTQTLKGQNVLIILNKGDLKNKVTGSELKELLDIDQIVSVSALKRDGLDELEESIVERVWHSTAIDAHEIIVSNARHIQALTNCLKQVESAKEKLEQGLSLEFVSEEIKMAINFLDSITGKNIDADLLDQIFSSFCIGK